MEIAVKTLLLIALLFVPSFTIADEVTVQTPCDSCRSDAQWYGALLAVARWEKDRINMDILALSIIREEARIQGDDEAVQLTTEQIADLEEQLKTAEMNITLLEECYKGAQEVYMWCMYWAYKQIIYVPLPFKAPQPDPMFN